MPSVDDRICAIIDKFYWVHKRIAPPTTDPIGDLEIIISRMKLELADIGMLERKILRLEQTIDDLRSENASLESHISFLEEKLEEFSKHQDNK